MISIPKRKDLQKLTAKNILITCGPTWIPIDSVRVISNTSSGRMGHLIAQKLNQQGARITLLQGPVTDSLPMDGVKVIKFQYYDELRKLLTAELKKKYAALIHCAAVSDFRLERVFINKLKSNLSKLTLQLVPTEKLISQARKINPKIFIVGFKLEINKSLDDLKHKALHLIEQSHCDLVLANSVTSSEYRGYIIDRFGTILAQAKNKERISSQLSKILCEIL